MWFLFFFFFFVVVGGGGDVRGVRPRERAPGEHDGFGTSPRHLPSGDPMLPSIILALLTRGRDTVINTLEKSPQPALDTYHTCIYPLLDRRHSDDPSPLSLFSMSYSSRARVPIPE